MLGARTFRDATWFRDSFYTIYPYKTIVGDTRKEQWTRAQRGVAERLVFCATKCCSKSVNATARADATAAGRAGENVGEAASGAGRVRERARPTHLAFGRLRQGQGRPSSWLPQLSKATQRRIWCRQAGELYSELPPRRFGFW